MKKMISSFLLLLVGLCPICTHAQNSPTDSLSKKERIADLKYFIDQILSIHPAPYRICERSEWDKLSDKLENGIENLDASGFFFRFQEAAAMVDDIHTSVFPIDDQGILTSTYPIRLRRMGDGIYVRAADEANIELVGTRLITVQGMAIEDVVKKVAELTPGSTRRQDSNVVLAYLICPGTYRYLGLLGDGDHLDIKVINAEGEQKKVILHSEPTSLMSAYNSATVLGWSAPPGWGSVLDSQKMEVPVFYKKRHQMGWLQPVPEKKALLVQINQPKPDDDNTVRNFIASLFNHLINNKYERIILDLRGNEGGWYNLTNALAGIFSSFSSSQLIVLIGSETTSAGVVLATQLEMQTNAIFIGEGTGSSPNFFGTYKAKPLPNSGMYYRISTKRHGISVPEDTRVRLWPDLVVTEKIEDLLEGRDNAMEKALLMDLEEYTEVRYDWYERWNRPSQHH